MPLFRPTVRLRRVTGITPQMLNALGVRALLLDVDNTLTTHNNPVPDGDVLIWLDKMKDTGVKLMLVSNNRPGRVEPFARALGLAFTANAAKPLTAGFSRAAAELGLSPREIGIAGDQVFTDILGGNLFGAKTFLVEPMEPEEGWFFRWKRRLERFILNA